MSQTKIYTGLISDVSYYEKILFMPNALKM